MSFVPVQIDWAVALRLLADHLQTAVAGFASATGFYLRGEQVSDQDERFLKIVALDAAPIERNRAPAQADMADAVLSLTVGVRESIVRLDLLALERVVSALCQALRVHAIDARSTQQHLIEFIAEPAVQYDGEPDPQTLMRTAGVTVSLRVLRTTGTALEAVA